MVTKGEILREELLKAAQNKVKSTNCIKVKIDKTQVCVGNVEKKIKWFNTS